MVGVEGYYYKITRDLIFDNAFTAQVTPDGHYTYIFSRTSPREIIVDSRSGETVAELNIKEIMGEEHKYIFTNIFVSNEDVLILVHPDDTRFLPILYDFRNRHATAGREQPIFIGKWDRLARYYSGEILIFKYSNGVRQVCVYDVSKGVGE
jgi:hypothetical protein